MYCLLYCIIDCIVFHCIALCGILYCIAFCIRASESRVNVTLDGTYGQAQGWNFFRASSQESK